MKQLIIKLLFTFLGMWFCVSAFAESQNVNMSVGEVKTLYLPSTVTSKNLKSVTFYSNGISYVQVQSYNNYSVTIKAIKEFSSTIIVRCDYRYYVNNNGYVYEAAGYYDYYVTVTGNGANDPSAVSPTRIYFSNSAAAVNVGESRQLEPIIEPSNATYTLTWSINDTYIASISQDGVLTGKNEGYADLTVKTNNGLYTMLRIVVSKPAATSVTVTPSSLTLTEGESKYLSKSVYPSSANQSVTWSSSNTSVATVSSSGYVTAKSAGSCIITATTSNGKKGTCSVSVKAKTIDPSSISVIENIELLCGETYVLTPDIYPINATYSLHWESEDPMVATVSEEGEICGISPGETNVIVSIDESSLSASCFVVVKDKQTSVYKPGSDDFNVSIGQGKIYFATETNATLCDCFGKIIFKGHTQQIQDIQPGIYILRYNNRVFRTVFLKT